MIRKEQTLQFPRGFLFGTATAAHQIEGNNTHSDWWKWEQSGQLSVKSGEACNSWKLWRQDADLNKSLHMSAYRFSIEWARIEPEEGRFNLEALKHYDEEIKYLHRLGTKVMLTLWHFTLPAWFAHKGGFTKKENLWYFSRYVEFVLENLTEYPDFWITLNEPNNTYLGAGFLTSIWPPGKKSKWLALRVLWNLASVHKATYRLIHHRITGAMVGVASNMAFIDAFGQNPLLQMAAGISRLINNDLFLWLTLWHHDFIGLNYYIVHRVRWRDLFRRITRRVVETQLGERIDLAWIIYPQGLYDIIMDLRRYRLPIFVTENGVADESDGRRKLFITDHLEWLWQAIADGADVRGYFHWTLMDNFEWSSGYVPKFGLCETDRKNFKRTPRESARLYAEIARTGRLVVGGK